jgi:outer membrane usher protein
MKIKNIVGFMICCFSSGGYAELYFDANALNLSDEEKKQLNLSELMQPEAQIPGEYSVDILVNGQEALTQKVRFALCGSRLCPELDVSLLTRIGVKTDAFPALMTLSPARPVANLADYIPGASADFDFSHMALKLSIPQAAMINQARGDIPPEKWQDGLNMAFVNYNLTGAYDAGKTGQGDNQYLNLRSGVNVGPWRARHYGYYNRNSQTGTHWNSLQSFIERDIRQLRSRLTIGESATQGLVFDSFSFKGMGLATDSEMLPESQRGFAPVIRGIAMSNAQVEVWQKNNLIYQTYVSPGEFAISDLYPTSTSGDLRVIIREENGNERTFTQPFSAAPTMIRQGQMQFAITGGEYASESPSAKRARFAQGEVVYGVLNGTTLYAGAIGAEHYAALALGSGQSLGTLGALSFDITAAKATLQDGQEKKGQSYQFRYSKNITATDTIMTLAGYRYSTENYYSFEDASEYWQRSANMFNGSPKNRMQLTMSQSLGSYGSLSLSAYQQDYWRGSQGKNQSLMASYNVNVRGVSLNVGYSNNRSRNNQESDRVWSVNASMPLSQWLSSGNNSMHLSLNTLRAENGRMASSAMLSGSALEDRNLSYSVSQSDTRGESGQGSQANSAATLQYVGSRVTANAGYSNNNGSNHRFNYGLQGAIVAHPYGVTLGQNLNDDGGSALVRAPGASQVKISNAQGLYTDSRGYAIVPYLSQYRSNTVVLDSQTLKDDVDVNNPIRQVVPNKGALVLADYKTKIGHRVFLTLTRTNGKVPFGAVVSAGDSVTGIVNEQGEVFLNGVEDRSLIKASWGGGLGCSVPLDVSNVKKVNGIALLTLKCQ